MAASALLSCLLCASCRPEDGVSKIPLEDHTAQQRLRAGGDILAVLTGQPTVGARRKEAILSRLIPLPAPQAPELWTSICEAAQRKGNSAITAALADVLHGVPDIDGSQGNKCSLTRFPSCRRFADALINRWLAGLFYAIADGSCLEGPIPQVELSRYDLFHAHLFLDYTRRDCGLLFHAKEYPKYDEDAFPINLGFCQTGSNVEFNQTSMEFRNFLWYKGMLVGLDVSQDSILEELLNPFQNITRTVFEEEFGSTVVDVNYFDSLTSLPKPERIFIC